MSRYQGADLRMWRAFLHDLVMWDDYQYEIVKIRRKHVIPPVGYSLAGGKQVPPTAWKENRLKQIRNRGLEFELNADEFCTMDLYQDVAALNARYGLFFPLEYNPTHFFVFYDQLPTEEEMTFQNPKDDGFSLNDVFLEKPSFLVNALLCASDDQKKFIAEQQKNKELVFPISLRVSLFSSQSDIWDYLNRNWKKLIEPEIVKARNNLGLNRRPRRRSLRVAMVERFILSNKDKDAQEIKKQLRIFLGCGKTTSEIQSIIAKKRLNYNKKLKP